MIKVSEQVKGNLGKPFFPVFGSIILVQNKVTNLRNHEIKMIFKNKENNTVNRLVRRLSVQYCTDAAVTDSRPIRSSR